MTTCTEFAVFDVKKANLAQVLALSECLFSEINVEQKNIVAHEILVKIDRAEQQKNNESSESDDTLEICWHLTWASVAVVEASSSKWASYPSAAAIESLVGKKHYYGHFVAVV